MTQDHDPSEDVVQALLRAREGGPAADDAALAGRVGSLEQAYAIQESVVARLDGNAVPRYWKSGAPTRSDPLRHAPLPAAGVRKSGASVADLPLRHRWIEAEVALRIGREVTADDARALNVETAQRFVDAMSVSIEVVDSRWAAARDAAPLLRVADLLVHGALVLGEFVPFQARDWAQQECQVRIGAGDWQVFRGSLGIADPAWVLPEWLRHATRHGAPVPAGTVVTCGTWCGLLEAQAGDAVEVQFPGIGAARLQF
jgi:2-keto-4-pentenoate hydratase